MTTRITPDRPTILALLDKDEDFRIEITGAVVAAVAQRMYQKDLHKIIEKAAPAVFAEVTKLVEEDTAFELQIQQMIRAKLQARPVSYFEKMVLKPEVAEKIMPIAEQIIVSSINSIVQKVAEEKLATLNVDEMVEKRLARLTNEAVDKLVRSRLEEKMAAVRAAL